MLLLLVGEYYLKLSWLHRQHFSALCFVIAHWKVNVGLVTKSNCMSGKGRGTIQVNDIHLSLIVKLYLSKGKRTFNICVGLMFRLEVLNIISYKYNLANTSNFLKD